MCECVCYCAYFYYVNKLYVHVCVLERAKHSIFALPNPLSCSVMNKICLNQDAIEMFSHTFLIDNHVRLHSSQNASYTRDVCDMHLRLTAKPHLCVICGTFHTELLPQFID